jgi:polyisoprenoid-binding protein YceI
MPRATAQHSRSGVVMTMLRERSEPAVTAIDPSPPIPTGTWTIDPSHSSVSLAWRKHRRWTITSRQHCIGVIHLDALPPVGVIQFEQPSGVPVLTLALDPAGVEPHDPDLNAMLGSPDVVDVRRHRWWTLHSQSLEVLPTGAWRVMATLITANGTPGLVELRLEVDPEASSPDRLVLRGREGTGSTWVRHGQARLDLHAQTPDRPGRAGQARGDRTRS